MNVAIIGAGNIGGTLARKLAGAGHHVSLGVRDVAKAADLAAQIGQGTDVKSPAQAVAEADAVIFALPGGVMPDILGELSQALAGKVLIDATNNLSPGQPLNSIALLTEKAPTASVYRAFNTLGWENFANPMFGGTQADLFYCGPAGDPQKVAEDIIQGVGLRPVYVGGVDQTAVVDGVASLWFALVFGQKRPRRLAFRLLED
ncbi:MAG TPA: NAD(P)-binding domain-containing protein [Chloroflexota bacterium]|nr:NAD(P)-binding domain-containing protein [Chloroflexota bacterium]